MEEKSLTVYDIYSVPYLQLHTNAGAISVLILVVSTLSNSEVP